MFFQLVSAIKMLGALLYKRKYIYYIPIDKFHLKGLKWDAVLTTADYPPL